MIRISSTWKRLVPVLCLAAACCRAAEVYPAAILPFAEKGAGAKGLGAQASDLLFANLVTQDGVLLVDREDLQELLLEAHLSLSGMVRSDEAAQVGRLTGAKILITGSVLQTGGGTYVVCKMISSETGKVLGASAKGEPDAEIDGLVEELAGKVAETLRTKASTIVAERVTEEDRVATITKAIGDAERPSVTVAIPEEHIGRRVIDPAAETEISMLCGKTGFTVIDAKTDAAKTADIRIEGEAFSEFAGRTGTLISVKARVEVKAVEAKTGKVLATDRQMAVVLDVAENVAGKKALQQAAAEIAVRLLPELVK